MGDFIGYAKLRPGRIHLFCPGCKRKLSNMPRFNDPKEAVLAILFCAECSNGGKDSDTNYRTANGRAMVFDGKHWSADRRDEKA